MKDASWEDCIENNSVKYASPNIERANSLKETAEERINIISEINERNCNFVFENYYTYLLKILQTLAFKKGFNF